MGDKISVVIPLFNRLDIFTKCIESLTVQSLGSEYVQLIVVDDCSTDGAGPVLRELKKKIANLTVITHEVNRGLSAARNSGINVVEDGLILFLDADMVACPTLLEQHVAHHSRPGSAGLAVVSNVCYPSQYIDGSNFSRFMQARELAFRSRSARKNLDYNDLPYNFFAGGATSVKASMVKKVGGFDSDFTTYGCEDEDFGWRLKREGGRIIFAEAAIVFHHDIISMSRVKAKMMEAAANSYRMISARNPDQILGTKAQYTLPMDLRKDSVSTLAVKLALAVALNRFTVGALEAVARKTDGIRLLYCEVALRALTAGWMIVAAHGKGSEGNGVWK